MGKLINYRKGRILTSRYLVIGLLITHVLINPNDRDLSATLTVLCNKMHLLYFFLLD